MKVYLAGPVHGLPYQYATDWRDAIKERMEEVGIECLDPMRDKEELNDLLDVLGGPYPHIMLSNQEGLVARARNDILLSNVVLAYFPSVEYEGTHGGVSIGTMFEIAWADAFRIPVVCVLPPGETRHDHPFIRETCLVANSLVEGDQMIRSILNVKVMT